MRDGHATDGHGDAHFVLAAESLGRAIADLLYDAVQRGVASGPDVTRMMADYTASSEGDVMDGYARDLLTRTVLERLIHKTEASD